MTKIQINDVVRDMTAKEQAEFDARQVTPLSAFEQSLSDLREKRNSLLQECDWWGVSDNTMTAEQTKYRQDLRDITNGLTTVEQVEAVEVPTKPS